MTPHYPDLGSAAEEICLSQSRALPWSGFWMTRHQCGISALVSWTSFRRETSGGVAKCRLFSQSRYFCYEPISLYLSIWLNHFKWTDCAVEDTPKAANIYSQNLKQDFWDLTTTGQRFPKLSQSQQRISELTYVYSTPIWKSARKGFPTYLRGSKGLCSQGKNRVSLNEN